MLLYGKLLGFRSGYFRGPLHCCDVSVCACVRVYVCVWMLVYNYMTRMLLYLPKTNFCYYKAVLISRCLFVE